MQGGAVLIPAPFPVCDGGPVLFSVFLSRFPCATGPRPVSRVRWGPVLFPVFLSRFPHAAGSCPVSSVSVSFPACSGVLPRFPFCPVSRVRWGACSVFRVSVSFPACSGFLPCSPVCTTRGSLPVPGVAGRFPDACPIKYAAFLWLLSFH